MQAQSSKAKVLGLAERRRRHDQLDQAGQGIRHKMRLAALLMFLTDIHSLGLDTAQGIVLTDSFYWDLNDRTRAFTNRVTPKTATSGRPWCRPAVFRRRCII